MARPLLHIGYHKTGTTWLQERLFRNAAAGFAAFGKHADITDRLVVPHAFDFDPVGCRDYFEPRILVMAERGLTAVLSAERLCGNPHSGGHDSKELADRLASSFPEGRVLVVIREQTAMIGSTYAQYVRAGGRCSLAQYLEPPAGQRHRVPAFSFDHFKYDRLITHYLERFGPSRVRVLAYELFAHSPRDYVADIVEFAGVTPQEGVLDRLPFSARDNEGLSALAITVRRALNLIVHGDGFNPRPLVRMPPKVARRFLRRSAALAETIVPRPVVEAMTRRLLAAVRDRVGRRYAESNARTARLTGLDLGPIGYDL